MADAGARGRSQRSRPRNLVDARLRVHHVVGGLRVLDDDLLLGGHAADDLFGRRALDVGQIRRPFNLGKLSSISGMAQGDGG